MGYSDNKKRRKKQASADGVSGVVNGTIWGAACGLIALPVLGIVFSFLALSFEDPEALTSYFAVAALYISAIAAGAVAALKQRENPLACGLFSGAVIMIFLWAASFLFPRDYSANIPAFYALGMRGLTVAASLAGAYACDHILKQKISRRRRKR